MCDAPNSGSEAKNELSRIGAPVRFVMILAVRVYQMTLSRLIPFGCRFQPTCSHYFVEAVQTHGALKGFLLGGYRILRCQPLCKGGFDPVPGSKNHSQPQAGEGSGPQASMDDL